MSYNPTGYFPSGYWEPSYFSETLVPDTPGNSTITGGYFSQGYYARGYFQTVLFGYYSEQINPNTNSSPGIKCLVSPAGPASSYSIVKMILVKPQNRFLYKRNSRIKFAHVPSITVCNQNLY